MPHNKNQIDVSCLHCGKEFTRKPSAIGKRVYCSLTCSSLYNGLGRTMYALAYRHVPVQPKTYKLIPLYKGLVTKVSNEDFDHLMKRLWSLQGRYVAGNHDLLHVYIVKELMRLPVMIGQVIDHKNGDRLDNRRSNLRVTDQASNIANGRRRNNSSGYKGVYYVKQYHKWTASISAEYKSIYIGIYDDPREAAWMRDQWALALYGEFAKLNFNYK